MAFEDLRAFITLLEKRNQLKRIRAEVDPELEIAEITDRVSKVGGPALLFENVRGHSIPVLINALGSRERMMLALGITDYSAITERITELTDAKSPQGLIEKIKMIPRLTDLGEDDVHDALDVTMIEMWVGRSDPLDQLGLDHNTPSQPQRNSCKTLFFGTVPNGQEAVKTHA